MLSHTLVPHFTPSRAYTLMVIAAIGTTISPWMQFYIQAAIVDKGVRENDYKFSRIDVVVGAIWTDIIAYFIIVACAATIYVHNLHAVHPIVVKDAGDVAVALAPLVGKFAALLFAIGLLNAAVFTASILPLSTAYYICEAFGFERGVDHRFRDAKVFYVFYLDPHRHWRGYGHHTRSSAAGHHLLLAGRQRDSCSPSCSSLCCCSSTTRGSWAATSTISFQLDRVGNGRRRRRPYARLQPSSSSRPSL